MSCSLHLDITGTAGNFAWAFAAELTPCFTAIVGASGAGKTTLLNSIAGFAGGTKGTVRMGDAVWQDSESGTFRPPHERHLGYVFQDNLLFPHLSVKRNILYDHRGPDTRFIELIDIFGIAHLLGRRPAGLSGGEARRVALARALMSDPAALLLDEPLTGIDAGRKARLLPYFEHIRDHFPGPVLYVTHDVEDALHLADHLVFVEGGRIASRGAPAAVMEDAAFRAFLDPAQRGSLLSGTVRRTDAGLAEINCGSGVRLYTQKAALPVGRKVRVHIPMDEVILALAPPGETSALNVLEGRVAAVRPSGPAAEVTVRLMNGSHITARITQASAGRLSLAAGQPVHAMIKALSVHTL